ncbi:MAG: hypothetical protein GW834_08780 [Cyanobacteria bacterium]|nr:hypothetical protein [Cyanobacteria bacterium CG_2015-09_32_10]
MKKTSNLGKSPSLQFWRSPPVPQFWGSPPAPNSGDRPPAPNSGGVREGLEVPKLGDLGALISPNSRGEERDLRTFIYYKIKLKIL